MLPSLDAIILSPGPGTPVKESDFGFNSKLIREANIPILGVCLGHQGIGTTFGAKLIHAPNIKHGQVCEIAHTSTGIFKDLPQKFKGVRYNSLVLDTEGKTAYCLYIIVKLQLTSIIRLRSPARVGTYSMDF